MTTVDPTLLLFSLLSGCVLGIPMSMVVQRLPKWVLEQSKKEALSALGQKGHTGPAANHKPPPYPVPLTGALCACAALLAFWIGSLYGVTSQALWIMAFCTALLILGVIDSRTYLLPDILTLPLLWLGLVYHLLWSPDFLSQAVWGAMAGYSLLWSIYWGFKLITGKEGMGYGDFKLLAAIGAWTGISQLTLVFLISASIGTLVGVALIALAPGTWKGRPLPFGPFLAAGGILGILAGDQLANILPWFVY